MKLKKQLISLAVMGVLTAGTAASAFAAGIGTVNFETLMTSHRNYQKAVVQMQGAVNETQDVLAKLK